MVCSLDELHVVVTQHNKNENISENIILSKNKWNYPLGGEKEFMNFIQI